MIFKQFFQTTLFIFSIFSIAYATESAETSLPAKFTYQFKTMPKTWMAVGNAIALTGMYAYNYKEIKKVGFKNFLKNAWKNKRSYKALWIPLTLLALIDAGYAGLQYKTPTGLMTNEERKNVAIEHFCMKNSVILNRLKKEVGTNLNYRQDINLVFLNDYLTLEEFKLLVTAVQEKHKNLLKRSLHYDEVTKTWSDNEMLYEPEASEFKAAEKALSDACTKKYEDDYEEKLQINAERKSVLIALRDIHQELGADQGKIDKINEYLMTDEARIFLKKIVAAEEKIKSKDITTALQGINERKEAGLALESKAWAYATPAI